MQPESIETFIDPIIAVCREQFPRKCGNCGREFSDFQDFAANTRPFGALLPTYLRDDLFGAISYVNCLCGNTITLECVDAAVNGRLAEAILREAVICGRPVRAILMDLRAEVRRRVLGAA
ncbi:MAG: hypothetical protein CVU79_01165 [Elusimicrobia bacterium HGW-Elusimicrobia-3]|nr:MAG: hypothetical protein CVU79_01165 [Elusimicrobia bacterium HGW-Elusimicrobia-3]